MLVRNRMAQSEYNKIEKSDESITRQNLRNKIYKIAKSEFEICFQNILKDKNIYFDQKEVEIFCNCLVDTLSKLHANTHITISPSSDLDKIVSNIDSEIEYQSKISQYENMIILSLDEDGESDSYKLIRYIIYNVTDYRKFKEIKIEDSISNFLFFKCYIRDVNHKICVLHNNSNPQKYIKNNNKKIAYISLVLLIAILAFYAGYYISNNLNTYSNHSECWHKEKIKGGSVETAEAYCDYLFYYKD